MTERCTVTAVSTFELIDPEIEFIPGMPEVLFRVHDVTGVSSSTTGSMSTGTWMLGPDGETSVGALGVLMDVVLGCALIANRPPGHWGVTTSISAEFCASIPADGTLLGQGQTVHLTETGGVAQGLIKTTSGTTVAVATQHIRFVPGGPVEYRPSIDVLAANGHRTILDLLDATHHSHDDRFELHLRAGPNVANPMGNLHGGIVLCLAEIAASMAVQSEQHPLEAASMHVAYVRPGPATGTVRFRTQVAFRGRTSAVVRIDCLRPDAKTCAVATVTLRGPR
jgi:uncharacterized protein (TIGR00369 family)